MFIESKHFDWWIHYCNHIHVKIGCGICKNHLAKTKTWTPTLFFWASTHHITFTTVTALDAFWRDYIKQGATQPSSGTIWGFSPQTQPLNVECQARRHWVPFLVLVCVDGKKKNINFKRRTCRFSSLLALNSTCWICYQDITSQSWVLDWLRWPVFFAKVQMFELWMCLTLKSYHRTSVCVKLDVPWPANHVRC